MQHQVGIGSGATFITEIITIIVEGASCPIFAIINGILLIGKGLLMIFDKGKGIKFCTILFLTIIPDGFWIESQ